MSEKIKPILAQVRKQLMTMGASEMESQDNPALQKMWDDIQALRTEMNEAKKEAAAEAAKPYLEAIEQIEKRYALMLKLSSNSTR